MSERSRRPRWELVAGIVIVLSGFAYMASGGIRENLVYNLTTTELLAKGEDIVNRSVRLGGQVAPNSVQLDANAVDLRFTMVDVGGAEPVRVHARKLPPAMFREGMGVLVEGRMTREGVFEATTLMVKHSNEYRAPENSEAAGTMYRSLIREN